MFFPPDVPRLACRLCSFEGSTGADSHGSNSDGHTGGGDGGGSGGGGGDVPDGAAGEMDPGDTSHAPPSPGILDQIGDALFGAPRTGDRIVDAFVTGITTAIPGAGLMMGLTNYARDQGWSVDDSGLSDLGYGEAGGAGNVLSAGPYRPTSGNPLAPAQAAPVAPIWAGSGGLSASPYVAPLAATLEAPAGSVAAVGAETPPDAYTPPEGDAKPLWPLLLVGAAVLAGAFL